MCFNDVLNAFLRFKKRFAAPALPPPPDAPRVPTAPRFWWERRRDAYDADVYRDPRLFPGATKRRSKRDNRLPARVLCLHGSGSNSDVTSVQLFALGAAERFVVDTLSGPVPAAPADAAFAMLSDGKFYSWWDGGPDGSADGALAGVLAFIARHGPYDGLYGFSQGANLAAILSAPGIAEHFGHEVSWSFVVCACGVDASNAAAREILYGGAAAERAAAEGDDDPFGPGAAKVPSLHLIGRKDGYRASSLRAAQCFRSPTVCYHDEGHELPPSLARDPAFHETTRAFFERVSDNPVS